MVPLWNSGRFPWHPPGHVQGPLAAQGRGAPDPLGAGAAVHGGQSLGFLSEKKNWLRQGYPEGGFLMIFSGDFFGR